MCFQHARPTHVCDFAHYRWLIRAFSNVLKHDDRYMAIGIRRMFEANNASTFANYDCGFIIRLLRGRVLVRNGLQATKTVKAMARPQNYTRTRRPPLA